MFKFRTDENILIVQRRHWFTLLTSFLWIGIIVLLAIFAFYLSKPTFEGIITALDSWVLVLASIIFVEIVLILIFSILSDYYLDLWVVTDQRSIRIELRGFFYRTITTINHNRIQDVAVSVRGFFPTLLNYGRIRIQTAGAEPDFVFYQIPNPYKIKDVIYKTAKKTTLPK